MQSGRHREPKPTGRYLPLGRKYKFARLCRRSSTPLCASISPQRSNFLICIKHESALTTSNEPPCVRFRSIQSPRLRETHCNPWLPFISPFRADSCYLGRRWFDRANCFQRRTAQSSSQQAMTTQLFCETWEQTPVRPILVLHEERHRIRSFIAHPDVV